MDERKITISKIASYSLIFTSLEYSWETNSIPKKILVVSYTVFLNMLSKLNIDTIGKDSEIDRNALASYNIMTNAVVEKLMNHLKSND